MFEGVESRALVCRDSSCKFRSFCRVFENSEGRSDFEAGFLGMGCDAYDAIPLEGVIKTKEVEVSAELVRLSQGATRGAKD